MDTTFNLLREDNKQILEMIRQLDQKILKLRKAGKLPVEYSQAISEIYQEATLPWVQRYYHYDIEPDPEIEQEIADKIYDFFLLLKALED